MKKLVDGGGSQLCREEVEWEEGCNNGAEGVVFLDIHLSH